MRSLCSSQTPCNTPRAGPAARHFAFLPATAHPRPLLEDQLFVRAQGPAFIGDRRAGQVGLGYCHGTPMGHVRIGGELILPVHADTVRVADAEQCFLGRAGYRYCTMYSTVPGGYCPALLYCTGRRSLQRAHIPQACHARCSQYTSVGPWRRLSILTLHRVANHPSSTGGTREGNQPNQPDQSRASCQKIQYIHYTLTPPAKPPATATSRYLPSLPARRDC